MPKTARSAPIALLTAAALALLPAVAPARTIALHERASLHRVAVGNGVHHFSGTATGTLPGNVAAHLRLSLSRVRGTVVFAPRGGTITVNVSGKPVSGSLSRVRGSMTVTAGTGKFAGARGSAAFSGSLSRGRIWRATVEAHGRLSY